MSVSIAKPIGRGRIEVVKGAVYEQDVDVIVNAANRAMRVGGGVDGAIHAAAGKVLIEELKKMAPDGAQTAKPVLTAAHQLPHRAILHAAGPVWQGGGSNEGSLLSQRYTNCPKLADNRGFKSIAFCGISTGIYRFPFSIAGNIALDQASEFLRAEPQQLELMFFSVYQQQEFDVYTQEAEKLDR